MRPEKAPGEMTVSTEITGVMAKAGFETVSDKWISS